jgi:hypothetical protein
LQNFKNQIITSLQLTYQSDTFRLYRQTNNTTIVSNSQPTSRFPTMQDMCQTFDQLSLNPSPKPSKEPSLKACE